MNSPLEIWEQEIRAAVFLAAPAKAGDLAKLLAERRITVDFVHESGLYFRAYIDQPEIEVGWPALEALWCASYAYVALYQTRCATQKTEGPRFQIGSKEFSLGRDLFSWSLNRLKADRSSEWPECLPLPTRPAGSIFDGLVLELFLTAIAWILHHECAHQLLQRPRPVGVSELDLEWEADQHATAWLLDGVASIDAATKIAMGICIAVGLVEANRDNRTSDSHPSPFDRLNKALRFYSLPEDGLGYAFALVVLQMNWYIREYTTWIQAEDLCFRELFEQFGRCVFGQPSSTWVSVLPEDAEGVDRALSAPLESSVTHALAYEYWERRQRPEGSPDEDWFAAEMFQHDFRLKVVIDWLKRKAQGTPPSH